MMRELRDLSAAFSELNTKVYEISYPNCDLGLIYVTPTTSTLVFDGNLSFSGLEQQALHWLPPKVFGRTLRLDRDSLFAATIFTQDGIVVEVDKEDPEEPWTGFYEWQRLMHRSKYLRAARFDVALKPSMVQFDEASRWYTFTADNPRYDDDSVGEITLQLPVGLPWTTELVRWAIVHHAQAECLEGAVDADALAAELGHVRHFSWF